MTPEGRPSQLAVQLAAAFVAVAVLAIGVLTALTVVTTSRQTDSLQARQHRDAAHAAAVAAGSAYRNQGSWSGSDLAPAGVVAASAQARLAVSDRSGRVVAVPTDELARMMADMHGVAVVDTPRGTPVTSPVKVGGRTVGSVSLTFPLSHDTPTDDLRTTLFRTAVVGAALASAIALVAAVWAASRITRPVVALTAAAGRLAGGDRSARADIGGPGELGTLAATFDDMADRLDAEDRARRQLVTDVAHELRTPLAVLQGETEALVDGVTDADGATLGSLHDEVLRLTRLVADLETLAAADASPLTLDVTSVDLADIAGRAVATVRATAELAEVQLVEHLEVAPVTGDADRLQQVALNLLSNAIKFTPSGGTVTVTTSPGDRGASLEIADTGPGLAHGEEALVFDRFWQGHAGKRAGTGSGIGLAVAAGIVAAHHGELLAENRTDVSGARFRVALRS